MGNFGYLSFIILLEAALLACCRADLVFTETPSDAVVVRGQPAAFHCAAYDSFQIGTFFVSWMHNNGQVNTGVRTTIYPNGTLLLTATQDGDEGTYSCTASAVDSLGGVGDVQTPTAALLRFAYLDAVFYHPTNLTVIDMQTLPAYFQCISGDSLPLALISWEKDGRPLTTGVGDIQIYSSPFGDQTSLKTSGTLQINAIRASHAGRYQCVVTNPLLPDSPKRSSVATLTVNANPGAPYISRAPTSQVIPLGQPATFPCIILGDPAPTITWHVTGALTDLTNTTSVQILWDGSLHFPSVSLVDEASYTCSGESRLGGVTTDAVTLFVASMDWAFVQEPMNLEVLQGQPATLVCRPPASRPAANVTWYRDNLLYLPRTGAIITGEGDLYFSNAAKSDEGVYFCVASNDFIPQQVTSMTAALHVAVQTSIIQPPNATTVVLGAELSLMCRAEGDPLPTIKWYKDSRQLVADSRTTIGSTGLLHIRNIAAIDEGTYTCEATNAYYTDTASAFVNVLIPPQITMGPGEVVVAEGQPTTIPCSVIGDPAPMITWLRDEVAIQIDLSDPTFVQTNEGLFVTMALVELAGNYRCHAENNVGTADAAGSLTVWTVPSITVYPQNQTAQEDTVVSFECAAMGTPAPALSWRFNDGALPTWASMTGQGGRLSIPRVLAESAGRYTCVATNAQGSVSADAFLDVQVEPTLATLPNMTITAGQQLTVPCQATGYPSPTYSWVRGQHILVTGGGVTVTTSGILTITGLSNDDQGWYSCVATNVVGSARTSFYLSVTDVPGLPIILEAYALSATSVSLVWTAGGDVADTTHFQVQYKPSVTQDWITSVDNLQAAYGSNTYRLTGLQENREYHVRVVAKNVVGQTPSIATAVLTPAVTGPSEPRNVGVSSFNATSISLVWEIPVSRSGPIDTYVIEHYKASNNDYGMLEIPGSGQATIMGTIAGLRPVTVYHLRVCAATLYNGTKQWGNCSELIQQQTLPAAPDAAPMNVSARTVSATTINVAWNPIPMFNENGPVQGYRVLFREAQSQLDYSMQEVTMDTTSALLVRLSPWTTYEVKVQGFNVEGAGPGSTNVEAKTLAAAPSGPPQDVVLSSLNQTAISVAWQPVRSAQRQGPIDGYTVFYKDTSAVTFLEINVEFIELTQIISGLSKAQSYQVQVLAYNVVDGLKLNGPRTELASISTADGIPGPITGLTAVQASDYILLQWNPPLVTNGRILGYVVTYMAVNTVPMTTTTQQAPPTGSMTEAAFPSNVETKDSQSRRKRQAIDQFANETMGTVETMDTQISLTNLRPETEFWIGVAARTSAGYAAELVSIYVTTGKRPVTPKATSVKPTRSVTQMTSTPQSAEVGFFNLFNLPKTSLILFLTLIGVGFLAIVLAIAVLSAWCSGRRRTHHVKRKATLLIPNDGRNSPGRSTPTDHELGIDNQSRSVSNSSVYKSHSPSNSSGMGGSMGLPPTPATMPMMDSQPLIHDGHHGDNADLLDSNRPRASSSPASAQLSVKHALPRLTLPATASVNLYPTAPNPRNGGRLGPNGDLLDTTPAGLEALYSRVNRTNLQPPSRLKKDSLAAIAVLLDQEENDSDLRPLDSPPSVVIANQRTTL